MAAGPLSSGSLSRAWYSAPISDFIRADADAIAGRLLTCGEFAVLPGQRDAWLAEIQILQAALDKLTGHVFFEFSIPRMGRRIDAVLLVGPVVFAVEFMVGALSFDRDSVDQVWDYALDLKNFHEAS